MLGDGTAAVVNRARGLQTGQPQALSHDLRYHDVTDRHAEAFVDALSEVEHVAGGAFRIEAFRIREDRRIEHRADLP